MLKEMVYTKEITTPDVLDSTVHSVEGGVKSHCSGFPSTSDRAGEGLGSQKARGQCQAARSRDCPGPKGNQAFGERNSGM